MPYHLRLPVLSDDDYVTTSRMACGRRAYDGEAKDPLFFYLVNKYMRCPECEAIARDIFNPANLPPLADQTPK